MLAHVGDYYTPLQLGLVGLAPVIVIVALKRRDRRRFEREQGRS